MEKIIVLVDPSLESEGVTGALLQEAIQRSLEEEGLASAFIAEAKMSPVWGARFLADEVRFSSPLLRDVELKDISLPSEGLAAVVAQRRREVPLSEITETFRESLSFQG